MSQRNQTRKLKNCTNSTNKTINSVKDVKSYRIRNLYNEKDKIKQSQMIIKLADRLTRNNDSLENYRNTLNKIIDLVILQAKVDMMNENTEKSRKR